jgi:hypothetical protein
VSTVRKLLWLTVGGVALALGALVVRQLSGAGERPDPKRLARSAAAAMSGLTDSIQSFATDVRQGMAEHEATLREAAELDGGRLGRPDAT